MEDKEKKMEESRRRRNLETKRFLMVEVAKHFCSAAGASTTRAIDDSIYIVNEIYRRTENETNK